MPFTYINLPFAGYISFSELLTNMNVIISVNVRTITQPDKTVIYCENDCENGR